MKKLLLLSSLALYSFSSFAYTKTEGLCAQSGQVNPWIKIELFNASNSEEQTYAVKFEYDFEGNLISEEKLTGVDPSFVATKATTEEGDDLFIIMTVKENLFRQYICQ